MPGMSEGKGEFSDLGKREQPIKKEFSSHVELSNRWKALLCLRALVPFKDSKTPGLSSSTVFEYLIFFKSQLLYCCGTNSFDQES